MALCELCKEVDFPSLLIECLHQCQERQEAYSSDGDGILPERDDSLWVKQHDDIFELRKTAKDCDLCGIILQAFEQRKVSNPEIARGLAIVFRPIKNKIEVSYSSKEGMIKLCGLDAYMNAADGEYVFREVLSPDVNAVSAVECFRVYQIEEDDSPPILKMIEKNPGSGASTTIASSWLRNCLENHQSCRPVCQNKPKRLIDVGNANRNPSLVETSAFPQQIMWLSLSYCWGEQPSMKLTKDTMDMLKDGIALENLDPTIRDAIFVTRALKIPYIWIDSLCIIQDSDGTEWSQEASKINEIYGGSTITLVVASADSVMDGFLKERRPQYIHVSSLSMPGTEYSDTDSPFKVYLSSEWDEIADSANGPWSRRGWTMQEGLLPNRLIYYTSSQMIWKCCEEEIFERGVVKSFDSITTLFERHSDDLSFGSGWLWGLGTFMKFKRFKDYVPDRVENLLSEPEMFRLWYDLIEEYSPREFRDVGDRLIALSGLARAFGSTIRCDEYVVGLWKPDLIRGLMWHTKGARLIPRDPRVGGRNVDNNCPSWSWVCVGRESVSNDQKGNHCLTSPSKVEEVRIDLVDPCQPFGMVKGGSLVLTGPLKKLSRLYNQAWRSMTESMSALERHISKTVEMESPAGGVSSRYSSPPGGHFAILHMLSTYYLRDSLVLEATGEASNGLYTYRRVGILTLHTFCSKDVASPRFLALREIARTSVSVRLGPQRKPPTTHKHTKELVEDLDNNPWSAATVIIV